MRPKRAGERGAAAVFVGIAGFGRTGVDLVVAASFPGSHLAGSRSFDDGPSAYTNTLLDTLRAASVPATFFVVSDAPLSVGQSGPHRLTRRRPPRRPTW